MSIAEVCAETLAGVRASAHDAAVTLALFVPADLAPLLGDRDRLVQVLTNLVSNAIKFSPRGGRVEIRAEAPARDRVRISVADEGPGIAAAQLHKLFGKFQQLDSSDTRTLGGTGLGLAISRAIVAEHDGTIGVESPEGRGATFWFELPRPKRTRPESQSRGGPRVLLAEDDVSFREIMAKQLGAIGAELLEAGTGAEALAIAGKTPLDLLVLDPGLPGGDGFALVAELRRSGLHPTPLLVYSARELDAEERDALTLGPTIHLTKSRSTERELLAAVRELLALGRSRRRLSEPP
jgi:CheY-like chemotaxis protein